MKNKSPIIWIIIIAVVVIGLFIFPKIFIKNNVANAKVPCLLPNMPMVQHIHPILKIEVDGANEIIPNEIGLSSSCEKAIHTHDEGDGTIHVEAQDNRQYTLNHFFSVWEKSISREGYNLEVTVDENVVQEPAKIIFKDGQKIMMKYTKI